MVNGLSPTRMETRGWGVGAGGVDSCTQSVCRDACSLGVGAGPWVAMERLGYADAWSQQLEGLK